MSNIHPARLLYEIASACRGVLSLRWLFLLDSRKNSLYKPNVIWRSHGPSLGYGIRHHADYTYFKRTFVYHKAGFTKWFMVVYDLIYEGSYIKVNLIIIISLQNCMCNKHACFTAPESCLATTVHLATSIILVRFMSE